MSARHVVDEVLGDAYRASPRGDHWRCIECGQVVPESEAAEWVDGFAPYHLRADRTVTPWRAYRCGPVLLMATYECESCEDLVELPAPLRVPRTVGFHTYRTPTGDAACGRLRRPDPTVEGEPPSG